MKPKPLQKLQQLSMKDTPLRTIQRHVLPKAMVLLEYAKHHRKLTMCQSKYGHQWYLQRCQHLQSNHLLQTVISANIQKQLLDWLLDLWLFSRLPLCSDGSLPRPGADTRPLSVTREIRLSLDPTPIDEGSGLCHFEHACVLLPFGIVVTHSHKNRPLVKQSCNLKRCVYVTHAPYCPCFICTTFVCFVRDCLLLTFADFCKAKVCKTMQETFPV